MSELKKQSLEQWLFKANEDLLVAIELEITGHYNAAVCFHLQQAIENFLKAYLLFKDQEIVRTHQLKFLLKQSVVFDKDFDLIDVLDLEEFAVDIRYPGTLLTPTKAETEEYIKIAKHVKQIVEQKIEF